MSKRGESLYHDSARVLDQLEKRKGSLKSIVFKSSGSLCRKKAIFALVSKSIENKRVVSDVIDKSKLLADNTKLSQSLALVLVTDLLYGQSSMRVKGPLTRLILRKESLLKSTLKTITTTSVEEAKICLPRYVRLNTLKGKATELIKELSTIGLKEITPSNKHKANENDWYYKDPLIPDLYVLPSSIKLTNSQLYISGKIILQDRSSCLSSWILSPSPGSSVIDTCAAPGNKTSHLAAIMNNTGKIHAFDRDKLRCQSMKKLLDKAGVTCVHCYNMDFLKVAPEKYSDVEYILVDPSCSGSGIIKRHEVHDEISSDRLTALSHFQSLILKHALSFPSVKRVVYSTCSIHKEENEAVVSDALDKFKDNFKLVHILPEWNNRGLAEYPEGICCIRVDPSHDMSQGFFVAMFELINN